MRFCKKDYEVHKGCFTNGHCCYDCPNFVCDEIEERFDIPCEDAGYSRIRCEDCSLESFRCEDCLFNGSDMCPDNVGGGVIRL